MFSLHLRSFRMLEASRRKDFFKGACYACMKTRNYSTDVEMCKTTFLEYVYEDSYFIRTAKLLF